MKVGQVIELDNGIKYIIAEVLELNDDKYIYMINFDNKSDIHFAKYTPDEIYFVEDANLFNTLIKIVAQKNTSSK